MVQLKTKFCKISNKHNLLFFKKSGPTVTKVVTVVKTKKASPETEKKKGELMVNDQDAMEVIKMCLLISFAK